jgi:hypothetical protein
MERREERRDSCLGPEHPTVDQFVACFRSLFLFPPNSRILIVLHSFSSKGLALVSGTP